MQWYYYESQSSPDLFQTSPFSQKPFTLLNDGRPRTHHQLHHTPIFLPSAHIWGRKSKRSQPTAAHRAAESNITKTSHRLHSSDMPRTPTRTVPNNLGRARFRSAPNASSDRGAWRAVIGHSKHAHNPRFALERRCVKLWSPLCKAVPMA